MSEYLPPKFIDGLLFVKVKGCSRFPSPPAKIMLATRAWPIEEAISLAGSIHFGGVKVLMSID